jgi:hypothetical protein
VSQESSKASIVAFHRLRLAMNMDWMDDGLRTALFEKLYDFSLNRSFSEFMRACLIRNTRSALLVAGDAGRLFALFAAMSSQFRRPME